MAKQDPVPDYIGFWQNEEIRSEASLGIFYLWEKLGISFDKNGKAKISGWEKTSDGLIFTKTYDDKANSNAIKTPIFYRGFAKDNFYHGTWDAEDERGLFALTNNVEGFEKSEISNYLFLSEAKVLFQQLKEKRNEFPFLPLNNI